MWAADEEDRGLQLRKIELHLRKREQQENGAPEKVFLLLNTETLLYKLLHKKRERKR